MRRITSHPAALAVTLAEVKGHIGLDAEDHDHTLLPYLRSAILDCEAETRRHFITRSLERKIDLFRGRIYLDADLQEVTSITYINAEGQTRTLNSDDYYVGTLRNKIAGFVVPAYGVCFPTARCQPEAVTINYVCGMGSTPDAIDDRAKDMIRLLTAHKFRNREAVLVGRISKIQDLSVLHIAEQLRSPIMEDYD